MNNFDNLLYALQSFYLLDRVENYEDHEEYQYFCELIYRIYDEIIALDTINKEDIDD